MIDGGAEANDALFQMAMATLERQTSEIEAFIKSATSLDASEVMLHEKIDDLQARLAEQRQIAQDYRDKLTPRIEALEKAVKEGRDD